MIGVEIKEINGNTLEFVNKSFMWLPKTITITIIANSVIANINMSSVS
jgi:hypothetical protein